MLPFTVNVTLLILNSPNESSAIAASTTPLNGVKDTAVALNPAKELSRADRLCVFRVFGPSSRQDAFQAVVALVACILVERIFGTPHRDHYGPRLGPGHRIVDG